MPPKKTSSGVKKASTPAVKKIRVVICDDNEKVRVTLARALKYKSDVEVVGESGSFEELAAQLPTVKAQIVLLDFNLPGLNGVDGIKHLRANGFAVPVIMMSADKRAEGPALQAGAVSFFYKGSTDLTLLVEGIRSAASV